MLKDLLEDEDRKNISLPSFRRKKKQVDVTGLELKKLAADLDLVFIYR